MLVGWFTMSTFFVELSEKWSPMSFSAALCFVFSSLGLLGALYKNRKILLGSTVVLIVFAGFVLTQRLLPLSSWLSEHWLSIFAEGGMLAMPPNVAFVFLLVSFALLTSRMNTQAWTAIFGSLAFAFGIAELFNYLLQPEPAFLWNSWSQIGLQASACFVVVGVSTIALAWTMEQGSKFWLPIPIAVALGIATLLLYRALSLAEIQSGLLWTVLIVGIAVLVTTTASALARSVRIPETG